MAVRADLQHLPPRSHWILHRSWGGMGGGMGKLRQREGKRLWAGTTVGLDPAN